MAKKELMTGNEAIARGLYEAGFRLGSAYPGTPSTEIFENLPQYKDVLYAEWAPNEKVATEVAYGASIAGFRSVTAMKHVGVNVAADPIFTASYNGVGGGFIIITADDPSMHSSQNEQDNRWYGVAAKLPVIEPSDSQECKDYVRIAAELSERFDTPILFRVTTRICHSKSPVELGERTEIDVPPYKRDIAKFVSTPAHAFAHRPVVEKRMQDIAALMNDHELIVETIAGDDIGVISAGVAYQYAREVFPENTSFLKLGLTWPLPLDRIRAFASK